MRLSRQHAKRSLSTSINFNSELTKKIGAAFLGLVAITACGTSPWDVSNATDRAAMKVQIKQSLTSGDCATAISLSTQIYNSSYVDNDARLLYASAQACNMGLQLFPVLDAITTSDFSGTDGIIRAFVRIFPSTSSDSRTVSAGLAQDGILSIVNSGAVIATADQINYNAYNTGSVVATDRNLDANSFLVFVSMGQLGTVFSRYGYPDGVSPASYGYAQGQDLPWGSESAVTNDTTGAACLVSSGLLNLSDSITDVIGTLSGTTSSQLTSIQTVVQSLINQAQTTYCITVAGHNAADCAAAARRLRYRGACKEMPAAAAITAGLVSAINAAWTDH